jgi:hypothetical protein
LLARAAQEQPEIAQNLSERGHRALAENAYGQAVMQFRDSLPFCRAVLSRDKRPISEFLAGMAGVAVGMGQAPRAARLLGPDRAMRAVVDEAGHDWMGVTPGSWAEYLRHRDQFRAHLDAGVFNEARAEGWAMPLEQAIAYALEDDTTAA